MIVSEHWLREWIDIDLDIHGLVDRLTMAGLEVDSLRRAGSELPAVVVGKIVDVLPHPASTGLAVCRVDVGAKKTLEVVCGAPNAESGLRVPTALPGATLPNGHTIASTEIKGIRSQAMLCSGTELGLEEDSQGLYPLDADAVLGARVEEYLRMSDWVIDIDLTPNRGDCLSILGIARELAVLTGRRISRRDVPGSRDDTTSALPVTVSDPQFCPRYLGRVVADIDPQATTPVWMRERLRRCGVRPISAVVDVTNYVMLELGQPMHAFDLTRIRGGIDVRLARSGETLGLLDGTEIDTDESTLVIADESGPIALAGIMGGSESGINEQTRNLFLEAAHFTPAAVAGRARSYGFNTDSSHRFERGVDPEVAFPAIHYATALLENITGGHAGPVVDWTSRRWLPKRRPVRVRQRRVEYLLGMSMSTSRIDAVLRRVAGNVERQNSAWAVTPPTYRFDIERECDLIEELVRVHGYDRVPVNPPKSTKTLGDFPESQIPATRIRCLLTDRDYQEVITYSFVDPRINGLFDDGDAAIRIANPIAENMSVLRTNLWSGLVRALIINLNRQHRRVRLFEIGHTFHRHRRDHHERLRLGGIACGEAAPTQWGRASRETDFYDVKADVEAILELAGVNKRYIFKALDNPGLHPGQSAVILQEDREVGITGKLHPELQRRLDLDCAVYLFQLDVAPLQQRVVPQFTRPSRFPAIQRDLAVVVDREVTASEILETVHRTGGKRIVNLNLFDVYRGEGIDPRRKSLAFGLTLQDSSRTLTDKEVDDIISKIIAELHRKFDARLRS